MTEKSQTEFEQIHEVEIFCKATIINVKVEQFWNYQMPSTIPEKSKPFVKVAYNKAIFDTPWSEFVLESGRWKLVPKTTLSLIM